MSLCVGPCFRNHHLLTKNYLPKMYPQIELSLEKAIVFFTIVKLSKTNILNICYRFKALCLNSFLSFSIKMFYSSMIRNEEGSHQAASHFVHLVTNCQRRMKKKQVLNCNPTTLLQFTTKIECRLPRKEKKSSLLVQNKN